MDESLAKARIVTQEWHGATASVRKLAAAFLALSQAAEAGSADDMQREYDRFLAEAAAYELAVTQTTAVRGRCEEELGQYRSVHEEIDVQIQAATQEIEALKRQLELETLARSRKQEYETIARRVAQLKGDEELRPALQGVEGGLATARKEREQLEGRIEARKQAFAPVLAALANMVEALKEEERAAAVSAAGGGSSADGSAGAAAGGEDKR